MLDESWRKDVQQVMLMIRRLTGLLRSQNLALLTDQLEQAGYRVVGRLRIDDGRGGEGDEGQFIQVARSCVREIEYQLLLAREAGLPGRSAYEPMRHEFREIRRMLAACIRRMRGGK